MDNLLPLIAVTCSSVKRGKPYAEMVIKYGGNPVLISTDEQLNDLDGFSVLHGLILGGGGDINPKFYGDQTSNSSASEYNDSLDSLEIRLAQRAMDTDIPVLGICRGMQVLNVACGGALSRNLDGHSESKNDDLNVASGETPSNFHRIFISPGSRLSATVGSGGFVRVNHRHRQGVKESQKSEYLMSSAWSMEDGLIEALESPTNDWVLGVQFHPERRGEIPPHFDRLFETLLFKAANTI